MTDMEVFEARFVRAYRRYLVDAPIQVDAAALAHAVAAQRRPRLVGWTWPFRASRSLVWVALAALLALALLGLLAVGASRLLDRTYPILTGGPEAGPVLAPSGDELWSLDNDGGLWHYAGGAWQGPLSPPLPDDESMSGLELGPDGALWTSGQKTVAVLRDGTWSIAWQAPPSGYVRGLVVAPDGTVWVGKNDQLVGLRREGAGYSAQTVQCPLDMSMLAATADGAIYVGNFSYAGDAGLARWDGATCELVDPLGDGQIHEVGGLAAGPAGSVVVGLFDEVSPGSGTVARDWIVMLRDGIWSTISESTDAPEPTHRLAIDPAGHPWAVDFRLGLMRYGDAGWRVVNPSAGSMAMAPDGVLWLGTDRGIERIQTYQFGQ